MNKVINFRGIPIRVRIGRKGDRVVGVAQFRSQYGGLCIAAYVDIAKIRRLIVGRLAQEQIGGLRGVLKRMGRKFKKKVNKIARRVAESKVLQKLRDGWSKVLESKVVGAGVNLAARGLSAFGVPAAATRVALNQRRFAAADRARHGGYAGIVADAASGRGGLRKAMRDAGERNLNAAKRAIPAALPGGGIIGGNYLRGFYAC